MKGLSNLGSVQCWRELRSMCNPARPSPWTLGISDCKPDTRMPDIRVSEHRPVV